MTTPPGPEAARRLTLQEIAQAKRDGRPLVMVTAYDYPSGRIAERAGVDLVLVGDSAAMTVLGHSSTVPATMDEMLMLTAAVSRACRRALVDRRPAVHVVPGERRGRPARRRAVPQGGRRAGRQAGGRRPDARAHPRAGGRRHPGRRPPRADAADGDLAGRLPRAGQDRPGGAAPAARRPCRRGRGRIPARARGRAGARRGAHQPASSRSRRSASARAPAATARCSCSTTCSASARGRCRASSSSTPSLGDQAVEAVARYADDVRERRFPQERHTYAISDDELEHFQRLVEAGSPVGADDEDGVL